MTHIPEVSLKQLLLGGEKPKVAVFVECDRCLGQGHYPVHHRGGPYGVDQTYLESCARCYNRTGKRLMTVEFDELVSLVKELG